MHMVMGVNSRSSQTVIADKAQYLPEEIFYIKFSSAHPTHYQSTQYFHCLFFFFLPENKFIIFPKVRLAVLRTLEVTSILTIYGNWCIILR